LRETDIISKKRYMIKKLLQAKDQIVMLTPSNLNV